MRCVDKSKVNSQVSSKAVHAQCPLTGIYTTDLGVSNDMLCSDVVSDRPFGLLEPARMLHIKRQFICNIARTLVSSEAHTCSAMIEIPEV